MVKDEAELLRKGEFIAQYGEMGGDLVALSLSSVLSKPLYTILDSNT